MKKENIDIINSLSWFLMDACWMLGMTELSYIMVLPTLVSGKALIFSEVKKADKLVMSSSYLWSLMNSLWLFSESFLQEELLFFAKLSFVLGLFTLIYGLLCSKEPKKILLKFQRLKFLRLR